MGPPSSQRIDFIAVLRPVAMLLVLYAHLGPEQIDRMHAVQPRPFALVRQFINQPFHIVQDFGWFGVVLFFLVSGFIVTKAAEQEPLPVFLVRRVFRIFPAFIFWAVAAVCIRAAFLGEAPPDFLTFLDRASLAGLRDGNLIGVEWTLLIELKFYIFVAVFIRIITRWPFMGSVGQLLAVWIALLFARSFGPEWFLQVVQLSYLPILLIGQLLYLLMTRRLRPSAFAVLLAATMVTYLEGVTIIQGSAVDDRPVTVLVAGLLFALCVSLHQSLRLPRWMAPAEAASYSAYLCHGPIGVTLIALMAPITGYWVALAAALTLIVPLALASDMLIERPSRSIGKALTSKTFAWRNPFRRTN